MKSKKMSGTTIASFPKPFLLEQSFLDFKNPFLAEVENTSSEKEDGAQRFQRFGRLSDSHQGNEKRIMKANIHEIKQIVIELSEEEINKVLQGIELYESPEKNQAIIIRLRKEKSQLGCFKP